MKIIYLVGVVIICAVMAMLIKENGSSTISVLIVVAGVVLLALHTASSIGQVALKFETISENIKAQRHVSMVLKCFGISFISEVAYDSLKDLGAESLGKWLTTAAKAEMLILILPFAGELIELALSAL